MKDFLKEHFDKLLLTFLFLVMALIVLGLVHGNANTDAVAWARELASGFQGALLGLITGVAIGRAVGKKDDVPPADGGK